MSSPAPPLRVVVEGIAGGESEGIVVSVAVEESSDVSGGSCAGDVNVSSPEPPFRVALLTARE